MDKHVTIEILLETVFSTRSVQRGYKKDIWGNRVSSVWEAAKKRDRWKRAVREPRFPMDLSPEVED
jgi:hypothetical protein